MNCSACGKANRDGASFCEYCGASMQAQLATNPLTAAPGPAPAAPVAVPAAQVVQMGESLIGKLSMGEKFSGAGALAAVVGFFLPWISASNQGAASPLLGAAGAARISLSGLDLAKAVGAVYLILLIAIAAGALCYFSSKAAASRKLMIAGYLVLLGALCGPGNLLALLFVSKVQSVAGFGLWLLALGYTAIAAGGLMTIRGLSNRIY